ncbi:MAG: ribosome hibernation-promoting factor, HPF/YfiA family [Natronincolaceae bacterium]|jgi:putative sigma-54 modulation protein|nr:ribosome-associated translation inhibitor RaiA [Bacillota bacterium]NLK90890.1 ribosome-associated translation inhibitor RaiA [Clostridiales bacterium]
MKTIVSGRNMDVTGALRDTVQSKLGKLDRFFHKELEAQVTMSVEKNRHIIEVTIPLNGSILRAEESTDDMYRSIDSVVDKLTRQLEKQKSKLENRINRYETIRFENIKDDETGAAEEFRIVRTKRFAMKPMNSEEAILQMELLGHNFYVFADAETNDVNVVYKRKDGNYGLIEPHF